MNPRRLSLALVACAALAAVAATRHRAPATASSPRAPVAVAPPRTPDAPTVTAARVGAPVVIRHALDLTSAMELEARASDRHDALEVHVTGALESTVVARRADGVTLSLRVVNPSVTAAQSGRDALTPTTRDLVAQQLAETFYVDRDVHGRVRAIRLPTHLDRLVAGILRHVVASAQVVTPDAARAARWTHRELDATGDCLAVYARDAAQTIARTRSDWRTAHAEPGAPRVEGTARARIALASDGEIDRLDDDVDLRTAAGDGVSAHNRAHVSLRRMSTDLATLSDDVTRAHLARWRALSPTRLDEAGEDPAAQAAADRRLLAGASLDDLRAQARGDATADAQRRLVALFRLTPTSVDDARRAVQRGLDARERDAITAALSTLGTPACQSALADIAGSTQLDAATRTGALTGLALVEHPTEETLGALERVSSREADRGVRDAATLALGAAGYAARASDAPFAATAFDALAARLASTSDAGEITALLDALGNTGDPRVMDLATHLVGHASPEVREAAVAVVRLVATPEADAFVVAQMRARDDDALRSGALRAAMFRALDPLLDGLESLTRDPERAMRARTVSMLGERLRDAPVAGELLLRVAESDPDAELRDAARAWLRQLDAAA